MAPYNKRQLFQSDTTNIDAAVLEKNGASIGNFGIDNLDHVKLDKLSRKQIDESLSL